MTAYDTYGTAAHWTSELVQLAQGGLVHIVIHPNLIPGDDSQDDLYAPEHPTTQVPLWITPGTADAAFSQRP